VRLGALLTYKTDRLAEAMDAYAHASAAITALLNKEPLNVDIRRIKAYTLLDEAYALTWLGRAEDALARRQQAVTIMKDLRATEPDSEILASAVAQTLSEAAESLHTVGNLGAAKRQLEEAD